MRYTITKLDISYLLAVLFTVFGHTARGDTANGINRDRSKNAKPTDKPYKLAAGKGLFTGQAGEQSIEARNEGKTILRTRKKGRLE